MKFIDHTFLGDLNAHNHNLGKFQLKKVPLWIAQQWNNLCRFMYDNLKVSLRIEGPEPEVSEILRFPYGVRN